jgi:hypothetical protein
LNNVAVLAVTTTAKAAVSLVAVVIAGALEAATNLVAVVDALKAMAKAASSHVRKAALKAVSKAVKTTTVLTPLVATALSHVKALLAATSVRAVVSAQTAVAPLVATLAKAKAPLAATLVPHVALKTVHREALMTVPQHAAHVLRLKQVAHRLTSQLAQRQASLLVAALMPRSAHLSHAHRVN